ncbi:ABC transporter substrate-binding protein [Phytomonospora endophytica]|uniref:Branched-chain amino acid transport system substrate-binding protein n=1 Tax=Phytomonospora endophytica TaxID=714109 RepID=A0A841FMX6_9ACTN|nr:ABC transporter substrate-binding protein [Phytomonospora endophytica]MBB6033300.1 branched-chain amino acid transport system substrate-binding protein [Phytomonospora endophytica]GIG65527.1 branched-chain amino acid ABC transporter substrate-binding protein [Phytomonospora endophytica]
MRLRVGSAAAASAAVLLLAAGCVDGGEAPADNSGLSGTGAGADCVIEAPVKVGLVISITGGAAFIGGYQQQGLELAFDELNAQRGVEYQVLLEDDKTSPEEGVAHYAKLIDSEKVSVIAGPTLSTVAFAAFPDAQEAGVPAIGMSTTAEGIPDLGDYIFRDSLSERVALGASIPAAVEALDLKRVAILYDGVDEFTSSAYRTMKEALEGLGIDVVGEEEFATTDTSFTEQLNRVKAAEPDAVVLSALLGATIPLVKQARELGLTAPIIGGNAFNSPVMVDELGPAAEGLIVAGAWSSALQSEGNEQFVANFTQRYGRPPDQFAAQAYTAAHLIDVAVRADCDASREAIKDNLGQILEQETVLGTLSIDENGEVYQDPVVQIVRNGVLVPLES